MKTIVLPTGLVITGLMPEDDCEPYQVELPMSGDKIGFKLLRVRHETAIRNYAKSQYGKTVVSGDPAYCFRLASYISTINGEEKDAVVKTEYVENLIARDTLALKNAIDERDFGADMLINPECPSCGTQYEMNMPFDRDFFRPRDPGSGSG